jgi:hypothetical protein
VDESSRSFGMARYQRRDIDVDQAAVADSDAAVDDVEIDVGDAAEDQ